MQINIKQLEERILDISKKLKLSHIGSNLSCLPVLIEIYEKKRPQDIVILDNAHAHLAHLVVIIEQPDRIKSINGEDQAERFIKLYGIHCDRQAGCDASGGSLGNGLGIGIGYALADKTRDVYVIVSEGTMMEGSSWESLRIANELQLDNLHIHTNFNSYSAVAKVDRVSLWEKMMSYAPDLEINYHATENGEGFEGLQGHYRVL